MPTQNSAKLVRWLYLDMNSYFASVEQELNPSLRGKPIAVVPLQTDTTCCIAVSYEGKAYGIKTGTKVGDAKKICPQMIFIEGDHLNYIRYHEKIIEAVESCLPVEKVCSIDEIACRLTGSQQELEAAKNIALQVKRALKEKVGVALLCSIGLAPNRYLAKIAADMQKPDGLTTILPEDLPDALYKLSLRDLPGVGPRMEVRLKKNHIHSMETLCSLTPKEMRHAWGSIVGEEMWHLLRGEELPEKKTDQKSIGHSHVLPPELRNPEGALKVMKKLTTKAALRLRREKFWATGMYIYVRFQGQESWKSGAQMLETQDTLELVHTVDELWEKLPEGQIFAVGMVLTGLVPDVFHTPSLFENRKRTNLIKVLDGVNEKFGKDVVHFGAVHESENIAPLRIAFTRIPTEDEA